MHCISKHSNRWTDKVSYILDFHQYGDVFLIPAIDLQKLKIYSRLLLYGFLQTDRQTFQLEYKETYDNIHKLSEVDKNLIR